MTDSSTLTSEQLVARATAGDADAVRELVSRHLTKLRAFIRLRCGPMLRAKESASDLAQSACRDVLENLSAFTWKGEAQFQAWLCLAAARKIADRVEFWGTARRDPAREVEDAEHALLDVYRQSASPSQIAQGREALERIETAFDALPEDYREAVLLSRILGLSRAEVAARMGRSEDSVRHLLFRGLAKLAQRLDAR
jgi:RNA polymerase sigma-70 factor (ECF subfamily)